jgi:hypothetical protein
MIFTICSREAEEAADWVSPSGLQWSASGPPWSAVGAAVVPVTVGAVVVVFWATWRRWRRRRRRSLLGPGCHRRGCSGRRRGRSGRRRRHRRGCVTGLVTVGAGAGLSGLHLPGIYPVRLKDFAADLWHLAPGTKDIAFVRPLPADGSELHPFGIVRPPVVVIAYSVRSAVATVGSVAHVPPRAVVLIWISRERHD